MNHFRFGNADTMGERIVSQSDCGFWNVDFGMFHVEHSEIHIPKSKIKTVRQLTVADRLNIHF